MLHKKIDQKNDKVISVWLRKSALQIIISTNTFFYINIKKNVFWYSTLIGIWSYEENTQKKIIECIVNDSIQ